MTKLINDFCCALSMADSDTKFAKDPCLFKEILNLIGQEHLCRFHIKSFKWFLIAQCNVNHCVIHPLNIHSSIVSSSICLIHLPFGLQFHPSIYYQSIHSVHLFMNILSIHHPFINLSIHC